jgi:hypothetical protein
MTWVMWPSAVRACGRPLNIRGALSRVRPPLVGIPPIRAAHSGFDAFLDVGEDHLGAEVAGAYRAHLAESVITAPGRPLRMGVM